MPGYITGERRSEVQRLLCSRCGLILRDPQQDPTTGELACRSCIEKIEMKHFRPDKAMDREIKELHVMCNNRRCSWKGPLADFEKHFEWCKLCQYGLGEQNADDSTASKLPPGGYHFSSPFEEDIQEEYVIPKADVATIDMTQHVHPTLERPSIGTDVNTHTVGRQPKKKAQRPKSCTSIDFDIKFAAVRNSAQALGEKQNQQQKELHRLDTTLSFNARGISSGFSQVSNMEFLLGDNGFCKDGKFEKSSCTICSKSFRDYSRVGKPEGGSAMQCCWKVSSNPSIHNSLHVSPAFYTSPNGYSFRAFLYPNGHGSSAGKNVSVFMTPVPGAYDDHLRWPVEGKLTFVLLNQENYARMVVKNFETIPFEKPLLSKFNPDMITAWGCQEFIPVTRFLEGGYLKDDVSQWEFQFLPRKRKLLLF